MLLNKRKITNMKKTNRYIAIYRWDLLQEITWKNREAMQRYFQRYNMNILNYEDIVKYLSEFLQAPFLEEKYKGRIEAKDYQIQLLRNNINKLKKLKTNK